MEDEFDPQAVIQHMDEIELPCTLREEMVALINKYATLERQVREACDFNEDDYEDLPA